jgi:hypothetical protein
MYISQLFERPFKKETGKMLKNIFILPYEEAKLFDKYRKKHQ